MSKIAIVTDSNSGIPQAQAEELGIFVIPMPFTIDEKEYFEGITLTVDAFYEMLKNDRDISTSQPSPEAVTALWDELLKKGYEEIVHIPMSSGLSGTCQTAIMLAEDYEGKVKVVNNQRISVTQKESVYDAIRMVRAGYSASQIHEVLEREKMEASIYITVDTLKYLKKGGRVTPAAAALGNLLKIKPVLQIHGEKLDAFAKARTMKQAKALMLDVMKQDFHNLFHDNENQDMMLYVVYSDNCAAAEEYREEVAAQFPGVEIELYPLSLSVSCHIGPGALALACAKKATVE